jgi:hypothetical protein
MLSTATESTLIAFFFGLIIIFGSFSNGLLVLTYMKCRRTMLSHPKDVLILSLAIGDFVLCFFACPFGFSSAIARKWLWGKPGCIWYAFITTWVGLASILQLSIWAIEQCITLQSSTLNVISVWKTFRVALACWLITFVFSCFPLMGWSDYTFEGLRLHCALSWDTKSLSNFSFCVVLLILFFIAPVSAILVSYVNLLFVVRRMYKDANRIWGSEALGTQECYAAQLKIAKQFVFMTIAFLFAWAPYAIMCILIMFTDVNIPLEIREYPSMFAKTAVLYNPIIYFFSYPKLRKNAWKTLKCVMIICDKSQNNIQHAL